MSDSYRISLADLAKSNQKILLKGSSRELDGQHTPTVEELTECLFFSPGDGRIWLDDQRMLLIHSSSFGLLRREMIDSLGLEKSRDILTRTGYLSGLRDAELIQKRWLDSDPASIFTAGTHLHGLEGVVKVETIHFEFDTEKGSYEGEFLWHHSSEDEEHIAAYGIGSSPACWMELGYAIGYVSGLVGSLVIFREVECQSMGHSVCRVIGKSAELWDDIEDDIRFLNVTSQNAELVTKLSPRLDLMEPKLLDDQPKMIGVSAAFTAANHSLQKVAPTNATVLFTGESGVGKELFASMLHKFSRQTGPFVAFNCAAIPENLMETELFGAEKGAYTGATSSRPGRFERANGGTLFLDEIGTLSLAGQSKLLRVLQEKEVERVGGISAIKVNVRVVAATNVDLRKAIEKGEFREDLFFRLNVFPIHLPPLKERKADLPLLINHFYHHFCQLHQKAPSGMTQTARRALLNYGFPGNIRELQNLMERGVIASEEGEPIDLPHLFRNEFIPEEIIYSVNRQGTLSHADIKKEATESLLEHISQFFGGKDHLNIEEFEQSLFQEAVDNAQGNLSEAARQVGLSRAQLAYRLKKNK
ncbi:sigma-54-dependent Fis family transcriptional regulator [Marinomonas rhizomae]|uniref:Regulatory Fis family protein n=1 Tax=Marinomonas rhizomae TaxID=491948 RepID=A0A366J2C2_9GAMM|nr:sigma-54-dependent Fis family transcriptional regulator [Marinomonas rhizomae]RBP81216.1 regulatory Fis family protein [Marinomonas rhizomae]RNF72368.1 sigma-54-dependent Fis family transcriptional regulator [Marinomonas rhizomae]